MLNAPVPKGATIKKAPAGQGGGSRVGNETKAQVEATQMGGSAAEAGGLKGAISHLEKEHPRRDTVSKHM